MCSNYRPVTRADRLLTFFGVEREAGELTEEVFPLGLAPFIRLGEEGSGGRVCHNGLFGLLPHWAELQHGRKTYNARSETVHRLPSFRDAWARGQRCIVPAECVFEPCYESGKAVRWAIEQPGQVPMGIAGIYTSWKGPDGRRLFTFAMLTVDAEGHPVYQRMHRPGDEKRMVVILDPADYGEWLSCTVEQASRFFRQWSGPLDATPAPLPPRAPATSSVRAARPPKKDAEPGLFD